MHFITKYNFSLELYLEVTRKENSLLSLYLSIRTRQGPKPLKWILRNIYYFQLFFFILLKAIKLNFTCILSVSYSRD